MVSEEEVFGDPQMGPISELLQMVVQPAWEAGLVLSSWMWSLSADWPVFLRQMFSPEVLLSLGSPPNNDIQLGDLQYLGLQVSAQKKDI